MPPRRSKRKVAEISPSVADPFSASKRKSKTSTDVIVCEEEEEKAQAVEEIIVREDVNVTESVVIKTDEVVVESRVKKSAAIFKSIFAKENVIVPGKWDNEDFGAGMEGKEWNLKIVTWNINGIRAWIEVVMFFFIRFYIY